MSQQVVHGRYLISPHFFELFVQENGQTNDLWKRGKWIFPERYLVRISLARPILLLLHAINRSGASLIGIFFTFGIILTFGRLRRKNQEVRRRWRKGENKWWRKQELEKAFCFLWLCSPKESCGGGYVGFHEVNIQTSLHIHCLIMTQYITSKILPVNLQGRSININVSSIDILMTHVIPRDVRKFVSITS